MPDALPGAPFLAKSGAIVAVIAFGRRADGNGGMIAVIMPLYWSSAPHSASEH
jgi:hypothetical protein